LKIKLFRDFWHTAAPGAAFTGDKQPIIQGFRRTKPVAQQLLLSEKSRILHALRCELMSKIQYD